MKSLEQVMLGLTRHARAAVLRDFRQDSCIGTTKTVIRVLDHFGYEAKPLECRVMVYNAKMVAALEQGIVPQNGEFNAWCDRTGAWGVGVGFPPRDGEDFSTTTPFVGHLIAAMPERGLFIDAALDQASRPAKKIRIPSMIVGTGIGPEFFTTTDWEVGMANGDGCRVCYQRIENNAWKMSPDWLYTTRTDRAVSTLIKHIEHMP